MITVLQGGGFVVVFTMAAVFGMLLVRKWISPVTLEKNHEVAAVFIGILGTIYSVLLAFAVFVVWTQFGDAQAAVSHEATQLSNLLEMTTSLPDEIKTRVRAGVKTYCQEAIQYDWPAMQTGNSSPQVDQAISGLWGSIMDFQPKNNDQAMIKDKLIDQIRSVGESRSLRLFHSHDELPTMIWLILWAGGILTIAFSYFFGLKNLKAQILMTAGLACSISLMMFTIWAINQPFTGVVVVTPEPLSFLLGKFHL